MSNETNEEDMKALEIFNNQYNPEEIKEIQEGFTAKVEEMEYDDIHTQW